jgi:hypothetical protein
MGERQSAHGKECNMEASDCYTETKSVVVKRAT